MGINLNSVTIPEKTTRKKTGDRKNISDSLLYLNKDLSFRKKKFSNKKKLSFYNDLHDLLSSGIDIKTTFDLVKDNFSKKEDISLVNEVQNAIVKGGTLSEALENTGKFSIYECYSIKIGEETGKLLNVLNDLSSFFSKKIEQQRKITGAFSYPVIVILSALAAIFFMMQFIVPMFEDIFKRFDRELPALTQFVINLSNRFTSYMIYFTLFLIVLAIFIRLVRKKDWWRQFISSMILRIPVFGKLIRKIHLSRFCLSMELLMSSRTPLLNAIQLIKKMITFYPINSSLSVIEQEILRGNSLHASLSGFKIYDKRMISLIKVAEEVNQLDAVFRRLKEQYTNEIDYQTGMIGSIMEPFMIIFIGLFVGMILISMYLPMFQLSTGVGF